MLLRLLKLLSERFRRLSSGARAELVATTFEIGSVVLFMASVFPEAFDDPRPSIAFACGFAVSAFVGLKLPGRGPSAWALASAARVFFWAAAVAPLAPWTEPQILVTTCGFGVMAAVVRRATYRRSFSSRSTEPHALAARLTADLGENAAVVGIVGGHLLLLFSVAYLRTESVALFRALWELFPALALLGTLGFSLALRPLVRPVLVALEESEGAGPSVLERGLARAQALARQLATVNFVLWLVSIVVGILSIQSRPGPRWADVVMPIGLGALFAWGVSSYQRAWHEDDLRPVVEGLSARSNQGSLGPGRTLRARLLSEFGRPVFFSLTLWLLASVGLYRNLGGSEWTRSDFHAIAALFASFVVLSIAMGAVFVRAARVLSAPLARIERAADAVAKGSLEDRVPLVDGPREVRALGRSIEEMRRALADTIASLERERAGLEANVERRTLELRHALTELREAQAALVQRERMASLGQLVAGVAHEIHNPLNAISGSVSSLERIREELQTMLEAYGRAEACLPDCERQAIARLRDELDVSGAVDDLAGVAKVVRSATSRGVAIVRNLSAFARASAEHVPVDLHDGLRESLSLLGHSFRSESITVETEFAEIPSVTCCAGELNQVFVNLLANARDAIAMSRSSRTDGASRIRVETRCVGEEVVIRVGDDGPGVDVGLDETIFEPFFTTKPTGRGTGLGLSISREILARHGGTLTLVREPTGRSGATFECRLPIAGPKLPASAQFVNKPYQARRDPC